MQTPFLLVSETLLLPHKIIAADACPSLYIDLLQAPEAMAWLKTYVLECLESIVPIIASRPVRYMFHHVHCQLTAVPSRPACLATAKKAFAAIGFEGLLCEGNPGQLLHQWRQPSSVKRPVRRQQLLEVFLQENGLHPCPCTPSLQLFHLGLAVRVLLADLFFLPRAPQRPYR